MQKYFIDTEFSEGMRKAIWWLPSIFGFNKKRWHIELISIGIKCEDGRSYYAINNDFHWENANEFVRKHVLTKLPPKYTYTETDVALDSWENTGARMAASRDANPLYKHLNEIACDIVDFINPHIANPELEKEEDYWRRHSLTVFAPDECKEGTFITRARPMFYAYFAAYDWVMLCTLFGSMIDLPTGFPFYCMDLKQMLDEQVWEIVEEERKASMGAGDFDHFSKVLRAIKDMSEYPKQEGMEHSALDDAEFNHKLYVFLCVLKSIRKNI